MLYRDSTSSLYTLHYRRKKTKTPQLSSYVVQVNTDRRQRCPPARTPPSLPPPWGTPPPCPPTSPCPRSRSRRLPPVIIQPLCGAEGTYVIIQPLYGGGGAIIIQSIWGGEGQRTTRFKLLQLRLQDLRTQAETYIYTVVALQQIGLFDLSVFHSSNQNLSTILILALRLQRQNIGNTHHTRNSRASIRYF